MSDCVVWNGIHHKTDMENYRGHGYPDPSLLCLHYNYYDTYNKCECSNSWGISLLSVIGKIYCRVLIKIVRAGTECAIGEEQYGFRQGRGCMDQVFAVTQVRESIWQMGKMYFGRLWIWKGPKFGQSARHVADSKSIWSWRKIVDKRCRVSR